jgi:acetyltransferase-like isoleucine patch superfamily enzyme
MTLGELIAQLGGRLAHGAAEAIVSGVNASGRSSGTDLLFAEDAGAAKQALAGKAAAVVVKLGCLPEYTSNAVAVIEADQPRLWFAQAAKILKAPSAITGVHPSAVLGSGVTLGEGVFVGPCAVIGDNARIGAYARIEAGASIGEGVIVGEQCRIYPRAVLYPGTTLGNRVVIQSGAVLGADGFGYVREDRQPGARGAQLRYRRRRDSRCADRDFRIFERRQRRRYSRTGRDWRSCADWSGRHSRRAGRRLQRIEGDERRPQTGHGPLRYTGATAAPGSSRAGNVGKVGEEESNQGIAT